MHCRDRLKIETLFLFPEKARANTWVKEFEERGIMHALIPENRNRFLAVRALLEKYQPLILHSHFVAYDLLAVMLKILPYKHSKVIWHLHSPGELSYWQQAKDLVKVELLARSFVDRIIAVGEGAYDNAKARGFGDRKLVLIPNGIDVNRFRSQDGARRRVRELLGAREDAVVYLLLGWDPHTKGVDLFIKAADQLRSSSERPSLFVIIGERETRDFIVRLPESSTRSPAR